MSKTSKKKKKSGKKKGFPPRVIKFIDFFIESGNATQSYIDSKYSENGAGQSARNLLKKPHIQDEIARRRLEIAKQADITMQDVINEHAKIAFANSEDFFKWGVQEIDLGDGKFERRAVLLIKPPDEISRKKKAAIAGIKETAKGGLEFKFHDKQKSLDFLGRYFGIGNDADIEKAKRLQKIEDQPPNPDPVGDMDEDAIDKALKELEE